MGEAPERLPLFQRTDQLLHIKLVLSKLSGVGGSYEVRSGIRDSLDQREWTVDLTKTLYACMRCPTNTNKCKSLSINK